MKKTICLAVLLALVLSACSGRAAPSSSKAAPPAASSRPAGSSASATKSEASSAESPSSVSSSGSADTSGWAKQFVSLPVSGADKKTLLVLYTPPEWGYDNFTTFTRGDVKIAEVVALHPLADAAAPFTSELTDP